MVKKCKFFFKVKLHFYMSLGRKHHHLSTIGDALSSETPFHKNEKIYIIPFFFSGGRQAGREGLCIRGPSPSCYPSFPSFLSTSRGSCLTSRCSCSPLHLSSTMAIHPIACSHASCASSSFAASAMVATAVSVFRA